MVTAAKHWPRVLLSLFAVLLLLTSASMAGGKHGVHKVSFHRSIDWDDEIFDIDLVDGSVIVTHDEGRNESTVEITDAYELYVDGRHIETNKEQKVLLKEYHTLSVQVCEEAKEIGYEGAKIGIRGAALGLKAVGGLFKLLSPHYDADDLERDLEREAEKIEKRAEKLEAEAERIEILVDELDEIAYEMTREIPELYKLRWF